MSKKSVYLIAFLCFCLNLVCSSREENYTVEIKDGVRHVHNYAPQWGDEPKIALEFVQQIGDLDTEDENFQLYRPNDVAVDGEGNIYVLDAGNYRIQKYDEQGTFISSFGRQGEGPGEFRFPNSIQVSPDKNIYVDDILRTVVLNSAGKELRGLRVEEGRFYRFKVLSSGEFISDGFLKLGAEYDGKPFNEPILKVFDDDLNIVREFCIPLDTGNWFTNRSMNEVKYTIDNDDNIYVAFALQNRIDKYSPDGQQAWSVDRQVDYEMTKMDPMERPPGGVVIMGGRSYGPGLNTFSQNIAVDGKGRSWVQTVMKQAEGNPRSEDYVPEESILELYDPDGVLLCRLPFPDIGEIYTYRIFGDRMFFVERMNEMAVFEYRIVEK